MTVEIACICLTTRSEMSPHHEAEGRERLEAGECLRKSLCSFVGRRRTIFFALLEFGKRVM